MIYIIIFAFLFKYDRVVLDLGTIENDATNAANQPDSEIYIEFNVQMEENNATQYDTEYWVSAGVTYDDGNEVWVGQTSFTAIDDSSDWVSPSYTTVIQNI